MESVVDAERTCIQSCTDCRTLRTPNQTTQNVLRNQVQRRVLESRKSIYTGHLNKVGHKSSKDLCFRPWVIFRVSPLFGMSSSPPSQKFLDAWTAKMKRDIITHIKRVYTLNKGSVTPPDLDVSISFEDHSRGNEDDSMSFKICVRNSCSTDSILLSAHLLLVGPTALDEMTLNAGKVCSLPLLLIEETNTSKLDQDDLLDALQQELPDQLSLALIESLEMTFDCVISELVMDMIDLKWAFAVWCPLTGSATADSEAKRNSNKLFTPTTSKDSANQKVVVHVDYVASSGMSSRHLVAFNQADLASEWHRIHDKRELCATKAEINEFYNYVLNEIRTNQREVSNGSEMPDQGDSADISCVRILSVDLPAVTLCRNPATVFMKSPAHVHSCLQFLTELCQSKLSPLSRLSDAHLF